MSDFSQLLLHDKRLP